MDINKLTKKERDQIRMAADFIDNGFNELLNKVSNDELNFDSNRNALFNSLTLAVSILKDYKEQITEFESK